MEDTYKIDIVSPENLVFSDKNVQEIIRKEDRCKAGTSVPAHALFLTKIEYPYILIDE